MIIELPGQGSPQPAATPPPATRSSESSSSRGGSDLYAANWFKKPKPRARAKAKPKPGLTRRENQLYDQMRSDFAQAATAGPKKLKKLMQQEAVDQYEVDELTGLGHPEAKDLIKAGISPDRVKALAQKYAPQHPAAEPSAAAPAQPNAGVGFTATPTDPQQYAADVLKEAGLPDTASNEQLLQDQMTVEGMPGSENNPLATSLPMTGSSSVNSAGVQDYPSLAEGAMAEAATLEQPNMASIYNALKSGTATPQQYAAGLAGSSYEGSDPAANAQYANSFLQDAGQPTTSFPTGGGAGPGGGGSPTSGLNFAAGAQAIADAGSTNLFGGLNNIIPGSGSALAANSLQQALSSLTSNPEMATEQANTQNAPGSPNQQTPNQTKINQVPVQQAAAYQALLSQLLPNISPGAAQ